ncbi:MAG TPA: DUF3147 family protein [Acidobacteriaceae bacterium]|nr:DUF3147 family protein [Acidobacteriaceae bacterium]
MVEFRISALKSTKPHEYLVRFIFGGAATVLAGIIAKHYGPTVGGLFLAFPAIFPASATLVESHEKERKRRIGYDGTHRGRMAASLDAAGAMLGAFGLVAFAALLWYFLPRHNAALVIAAATVVWFGVSIALWKLRKNRAFGLRAWQRVASHGTKQLSRR